MKQFLLDQYLCDECDFEFFVKIERLPEHCPKCTGMNISDAQTAKAQQWCGEKLE